MLLLDRHTKTNPNMNARGTKRVLVVDDEEPVVLVVQSCCEDIAGWEVLTAPNGYEGLKIAQTELPDAILLDVMMPVMDGLTFLKKIRENPITASIPIVLLSAKTTLTTPDRVASLGIAGAISKPFDPIALIDVVANILGWPVENY
jgi:CheY-like chemotaxis protein